MEKETVRRFMRKISGDNPKEGLIALIAEMTGQNPSEIELPEGAIEEMTRQIEEKIKIRELINPFYDNLKSLNTKESNKKASELVDLGKFIYYSKMDIKIVECSEQPDFIIEYQNELIGLEHTDLYDDEVVAQINTLKKIVNKCEMLIQANTNIVGLFNIIIIPMKLKGIIVTDDLVQTLFDCVKAKEEGNEFQKPDFVISITKSSQLTLELAVGEDYELSGLDEKYLSERIKKKETKIETYRKAKNIRECWLLMVIDGASAVSSFNIILDCLPTSSAFDKIFLFDFFKSEIIKGEMN